MLATQPVIGITTTLFQEEGGIKMDVYLIEDQSSLSLTYSTMLKKLGYSVTCFDCPEDFFGYYRSADYQPPSLAILSDVVMPNASGYDLMHEVRQRYPQQKFIIMSSTPEEDHQGDYACMYFCKPVSMERLEAALALLQQCKLCEAQGRKIDDEPCREADDRDSFFAGNKAADDWQCPQKANDSNPSASP
jgi:DNA-binding NtrC family response regulator